MLVNLSMAMNSSMHLENCVDLGGLERKEDMSKDPHAICACQLFSIHHVDVVGYCYQQLLEPPLQYRL